MNSARPGGPTVTDLVDHQVTADPGAPALRFPDGELSYGELDHRAASLAQALADRGVVAGDIVGLALAPSAGLITAMLAVLKLGAAYLPLALENPPARNAYILRDSGVRLVLRDRSVGAGFRTAVDITELPAPPVRQRLTGADSAERPAYVMYTSGSTGEPKGVVIAHRGIRRLVTGQDFCRLRAGDVIPLAANTAFDAATFEIWGALTSGALLVGIAKEQLLSAPELEKFIAAESVTVMHVPMAVFHLHARLTPAVFGGLEQLLTGGEAADPELVRRVLRSRPPGRLVHLYGPTECTAFATAQVLDQDVVSGARVPIGVPLAETEVLILGPDDRPVEPGRTGEIHLGGPGVALGYHRRPELSRERFVSLPGRGGTYYRTGDQGRWPAGGSIEFLGRLDDQVKLQGIRVEIGEVEAVVRRSAAVADCAVLLVGTEERRRLEAHVVLQHEDADVDALRRELAGELPPHMLPRTVHVWRELPMTANGKIDKARLSAGP